MTVAKMPVEVWMLTIFWLSAIAFFAWGKLPTPDGFTKVIQLVDTRAGNICVLSVMTLFTFISAMRLFYFAIHMIIDKQVTPENAVLMMGLQFVTGTAFGQFSGALLKTLNGEGNNAHPPDSSNNPGNKQP